MTADTVSPPSFLLFFLSPPPPEMGRGGAVKLHGAETLFLLLLLFLVKIERGREATIPHFPPFLAFFLATIFLFWRNALNIWGCGVLEVFSSLI